MEKNIIIWWSPNSWKWFLAESMCDDFWHNKYSWDQIRSELYNSLNMVERQRNMSLMYYLNDYNHFICNKNTSFENLILDRWVVDCVCLELVTNRYVFSKRLSEILNIWSKVLIEWVQNTPISVHKFLDSVKNPEDYKVIFLVKTDVSEIIENISLRKWSITQRQKTLLIDFYKYYSDLILKQTSSCKFDCIDTSWDFFQQMDRAKQLLITK